MLLINKEQMKLLDKTAIENYSIPSLILMEHAAKSACDYIINNYKNARKVLIISGTGNNGADGLCLARQLKLKNLEPVVFLLGNEEKLSDEGKIHYKSISKLNVQVYCLDKENENVFIDKLTNSILINEIIVDAIFGISLNREVGGIYKKVINLINQTNKVIISLDMPSGIEADSGKVLGVAVKADTTITFAYYKIGLVLNEGSEYAGKIILADISIPKLAEDKLEYPIKIIDEVSFNGLDKRKSSGHKGTFGKVLIIAGSKNMAGAASLSTKAAYRSGCGLVYVISHKENRNSILSYVPEAIVFEYDEKTSYEELDQLIQEQTKSVDSVLIGCGISKNIEAKVLVKIALELDKNLVLDADALNLISEDEKLLLQLKNRKNKTIITPHIGEMARLCSKKIEEIQDDPISIAKNFAKEYNLTVYLKSAKSILCFANHNTYINIRGNSGMATAGSGDVLAGIIAAKLALMKNGENFEKLVLKAVYMHNRAGDKAKEVRGEESLIASDMIEYLK